MPSQGSVTRLIQQLQHGDDDAARELWNRYCDRLAGLARRRLPGHLRRGQDEMAIANEAFFNFCGCLREGAFNTLNGREDLLKVLLAFTTNTARDAAKYEMRQKRGGGRVRGDSALCQPDGHPLVDQQVNPVNIAVSEEVFDQAMNKLGDATLQEILEMRLAGYNNQEIAEHLDRDRRTVERKFKRIRAILHDFLIAGGDC